MALSEALLVLISSRFSKGQFIIFGMCTANKLSVFVSQVSIVTPCRDGNGSVLAGIHPANRKQLTSKNFFMPCLA